MTGYYKDKLVKDKATGEWLIAERIGFAQEFPEDPTFNACTPESDPEICQMVQLLFDKFEFFIRVKLFLALGDGPLPGLGVGGGGGGGFLLLNRCLVVPLGVVKATDLGGLTFERLSIPGILCLLIFSSSAAS